MKLLFILMALAFIIGFIVMMVGAKQNRSQMKNVGYGMLAVGAGFLIYWFLIGKP